MSKIIKKYSSNQYTPDTSKRNTPATLSTKSNCTLLKPSKVIQEGDKTKRRGKQSISKIERIQ